jgi:hypothetical protein
MKTACAATCIACLSVSACFLPSTPARKDPLAGMVAAAPETKQLKAAIILSENFRNAVTYTRELSSWARYDPKQVFDRSVERLGKHFSAAPVVANPQEAQRAGADIVVVFDAFVESRLSHVTMQYKVIFLSLAGTQIDAVEGAAEGNVSQDVKGDVEALANEVDAHLGQAISQSQKLLALGTAKSTAPTVGVVDASTTGLAVSTKQRVLVIRLKPAGEVSPDVCRMVTNLILTHLDAVHGLSTIGEEDIQTMLDVEKRKDLLGCDSATCVAEIGGALGADLVIHGELGRLGAQYNINLSIVDSKGASVRGRVSLLVDAREDALVKELPKLTSSIVEKINAGTH